MLKDNQPDLIFVSDTIGKDMLTTNENYSGLKAVKDGKITVVKNKYFERPSGRITELLTEIAKAFLPKSPKPQAVRPKVPTAKKATMKTAKKPKTASLNLFHPMFPNNFNCI